VWINDTPVAVLHDGSSILAIHTDHRNAPLAVTDEARRVLWQAHVSDFGHAAPAIGSIAFNLRLSNQYFDAETGLHYNTHRYYDPQAKRYVSPDPMGLYAGPDLYAFALNRPHELADPLGLQPVQTNRDVRGWSTTERLRYVFERTAHSYPGALGEALRELVSPTALATTAAVFAIWGGAQFTPYGWAADIALAGIGYLFLGSAVWSVISGVFETSRLISTARCESDLRRAGDALARGLGQAVAASTGGALAAGASRVATLVRRVFHEAAPTTANRATSAAISESWFGRFVSGRTRSGAAENRDFLARQNGRGNAVYPPWAANRSVVDTWLNPGQRIYMVNYRDAIAPGGWATPRQFTSLAEARRELALLEEFKRPGANCCVLQEYTVRAPIPVRQGWAGPLTSRTNPAESYPGGAMQWELLLDRSLTRDGGWENFFDLGRRVELR
jgi:RHS repeat-associated protein